jgi:hypothetical protein
LLWLALILLAPPCQAIPPAFPIQQLVFQADEMITTPYQRPGDGTRRRLKTGWKGISHDLKTYPDDRLPSIRRKRAVDHVYFPVKNGKILRINNVSEFCAWALNYRILDVDFLDLGFHSGKNDCPRDYAYYQRNQHPENDESQYFHGRAPQTVNPFAGRPQDAMYGDQFMLSSTMRQRRADENARIFWKPIGIGDTVEGQGMVQFRLTLTSEDILPLKILSVWLVAEAVDRDNQDKPERIDVIGPRPPLDVPLIFSPGERATMLFEESYPMRDVTSSNLRIHFVVDFEDPWGKTIRKVHRTHYWKSNW